MNLKNFIKNYLNTLKAVSQKIDIGSIIQIIKALERKLKQAKTIFVAGNGDKAKNLVDNYVLIPSFDCGLVEDCHMILNHLITAYFKRKIHPVTFYE